MFWKYTELELQDEPGLTPDCSWIHHPSPRMHWAAKEPSLSHLLNLVCPGWPAKQAGFHSPNWPGSKRFNAKLARMQNKWQSWIWSGRELFVQRHNKAALLGSSKTSEVVDARAHTHTHTHTHTQTHTQREQVRSTVDSSTSSFKFSLFTFFSKMLTMTCVSVWYQSYL